MLSEAVTVLTCNKACKIMHVIIIGSHAISLINPWPVRNRESNINLRNKTNILLINWLSLFDIQCDETILFSVKQYKWIYQNKYYYPREWWIHEIMYNIKVCACLIEVKQNISNDLGMLEESRRKDILSDSLVDMKDPTQAIEYRKVS